MSRLEKSDPLGQEPKGPPLGPTPVNTLYGVIHGRSHTLSGHNSKSLVKIRIFNVLWRI